MFRPNCFQIVVQHFSDDEHYIFYFAGDTPEQAQVHFITTQEFDTVLNKCIELDVPAQIWRENMN